MELSASPPWGSLTIRGVIGSKVKTELFWTMSYTYNTLQKSLLEKNLHSGEGKNPCFIKKRKTTIFALSEKQHISHMNGSFIKQNN